MLNFSEIKYHVHMKRQTAPMETRHKIIRIDAR